MHRYPSAVLLPLLLLSACKIERTPDEVLDPRSEAAVERLEAQAELQTRVAAFRAAIGRGDRGAAIQALNPLPDATVLAPQEHAGPMWQGEMGLTQALERVLPARPANVSTPDLLVGINVRRNMGWFSSHLDLVPRQGDTIRDRMRVSGVFSREEGEWRLVQIHLSRPEAPAAPDSAAVDSAAAGARPGDGAARADSAADR